jgi:2-(1,2-epoxy-1,2-dihydrophenyl)acetyl-CoA isomerase
MSGTSAPTVKLEFRDQVAFLTMARPDSGNTMNQDFGRDFLAAALAIDAGSARAVVLSGQGKNFSFGGDLRGMIASGSDVTAYLAELTMTLHRGMAHLAAQAAPVIAAVNGSAAGGGLGLVLMADIVIAARSARFASAYTGVGLTPDLGCTYLLPRVIGRRRAMEMMLTNRVLDAPLALEWGLINKIVDDDELQAFAADLAARLAAGPTGAFGVVKRLQAESQPGYVEQMAREGRAISLQAATREGAEGIGAFLAKRAPRF